MLSRRGLFKAIGAIGLGALVTGKTSDKLIIGVDKAEAEKDYTTQSQLVHIDDNVSDWSLVYKRNASDYTGYITVYINDEPKYIKLL